ncbi:hypothetical protein M011DRAFT_274303 [Sporormia fimetaria CBS 119925]|uniref:Uncharacterized protein n=1 Tax=Sporormia fimetaria CBS 119925 TaxID=1340428 RepID=A0A6A6VIT5_9PLEO|nr:hypothetical protein M011DRAFT_274303 [Sporormia fimetaria CBS 119925]
MCHRVDICLHLRPRDPSTAMCTRLLETRKMVYVIDVQYQSSSQDGGSQKHGFCGWSVRQQPLRGDRSDDKECSEAPILSCNLLCIQAAHELTTRASTSSDLRQHPSSPFLEGWNHSRLLVSALTLETLYSGHLLSHPALRNFGGLDNVTAITAVPRHLARQILSSASGLPNPHLAAATTACKNPPLLLFHERSSQRQVCRRRAISGPKVVSSLASLKGTTLRKFQHWKLGFYRRKSVQPFNASMIGRRGNLDGGHSDAPRNTWSRAAQRMEGTSVRGVRNRG